MPDMDRPSLAAIPALCPGATPPLASGAAAAGAMRDTSSTTTNPAVRNTLWDI